MADYVLRTYLTTCYPLD